MSAQRHRKMSAQRHRCPESAICLLSATSKVRKALKEECTTTTTATAASGGGGGGDDGDGYYYYYYHLGVPHLHVNRPLGLSRMRAAPMSCPIFFWAKQCLLIICAEISREKQTASSLRYTLHTITNYSYADQ